MNIGINLLPFRNELGGAGNYAKNIVRELSEMDMENNYFLYITKSSLKHFQISKQNFKLIINPFNPAQFLIRVFWEQFILPFQLKKMKIEILFTPSVAVPYLFSGRMVTTVHDIAYKKVKNKYSMLRRFYMARVTKLALKRSEVIFTVSNFSKEEIIKEYNIFPEKILVTYNGANKYFSEPIDLIRSETIRAKYKLPEKYILYVGAIEPGKNIERLLKIFSDLTKLDSQNDLFLVLTGGMGWKKNTTFSLINKLSITDRIIILPYIPENELPIIYKLSKVLVYISYYEGFGLPVLEGLASGIPVLASDTPAIKEFAQNSAVLLNSLNEMSIKEELMDLLTNDGKRNELIKKGLLISKSFSWKNSARIVHSSFKKDDH
jgi:glycosyltransferase involved in cell wall biosynthesis